MPPPRAGNIQGPIRHDFNQRQPHFVGPPRPFEVWSCSLHGEFVRHGVAAGACYRCRREREDYQRERRDAVRKPPRPPHEKEPGCSMCGRFPLPGKRRSWCSDDCVDLWMIATTTAAALKHLTAIHGPCCWECGHYAEPERQNHYSANPGQILTPVRMVLLTLEVEHTRPLWSLTEQERTELRWWLPFNLALLCRTCHRAKTKREAAERAAIRRGQEAMI